ncbi:Non-specific lipid-transfer A [Gossypium arboreum]|uniref:Non-specific lipid-transfer protein n=4 Tax=Gossypium TaxID=3633 RepID=A0A0B0MTR3_GOSAR|nr:non-specific lipid-transfer protein 1-like [Gossypium arboreum]KHG04165.1 Non-specific lipid-transfer A [Gossypium arboreum]
MMKRAVISVFVMLAMFQFVVKQGQAAVTCKQVDDALAACVPYLTNGGVPSTPCCNGVGELRNSAETTADRQAACNCVKQAAARIPTIKEDDAATLPAKCHVQVDFPISKNTNCEDIH